MNRRTFLAALGIAPAVAIAKPEVEGPRVNWMPGEMTLRVIDPPLLPHQRELVDAKEREILLCGGVCSGKTHGVVAWCRDTPGDKIVALPSEWQFQPFYLAAGLMGGEYSKCTATITFVNGTRVRMIHPGTHPDSLRSLGILKIAFDGIGANDFDNLWLEFAEREAVPFYWQQVVYSVRPTSASAYLYRRFHENPSPLRRVISTRWVPSKEDSRMMEDACGPLERVPEWA